MEELEAYDFVDVFHFTKVPWRTHGVPFRFVVLPDGEFSDTKKRLQKRLGIPNGEMVKYRFAIVQMAPWKQPIYLEDGPSISCHHILRTSNSPAAPIDDIIYDYEWLPTDALGLDHIDTTGCERTVVIKG